MLPYNFGFEKYLGLALYLAGVLAFLLSIFWRPLVGLCYLIPLIPLQTTRYRMMQFPLGATVVTLMLFGVTIGLLRKRQWILPRTPWTVFLCVYALFNLASLFLDLHFLDARLREWWDYMMMPMLFFLVVAAVKEVREMKLIVLLMCLAALILDKGFWDTVSGRDYSTFSRDLQEGGAMGYAGVQGLAAFNAQFAWFLVALAGAWKSRWLKLGCMAFALFAANCVMYSFSRGAYVAVLAGWLFIGVAKQRSLLILLVLFVISWASLVPNAVRERVLMTYDPNSGQVDHSAELRLELWQDAMDLFHSNPILGTGFDTYAYMRRVHDYADTHNIYLKVLVETGAVGLALFIWLLGKTFYIGLRTFRRIRDPFFASLGLGLAAWIVCTVTANFFGDRWTYLQINGYLWVLAGLVARALIIQSNQAAPGLARKTTAARMGTPVLAAR